ncbi:hypothetical protein H0H92_008184, partial [Tricholoma furcatifolium]
FGIISIMMLDTLLNELENVAETTNELLLNDEDTLHCRALLSQAQEKISQLDPGDSSSSEFLQLSHRVSILSVALAPHKRFPPEILAVIFRMSRDLESDQFTSIPPNLDEIPWTLGRVCRKWRHLSRTMPEVWGTIRFIFNSFASPDLFSGLDRLRCVTEIVPDVCRVTVEASENDFDRFEVPAATLVPFLQCTDELDWDSTHSHRRESMEILPAGTLSRIQTLRVALNPNITSYPNLFSVRPRLTHLTLNSNSPTFLLSNIPWSQLQSFCLEIDNDDHLSTWIELGRLIPPMSSLHRLGLSLTAKLFPKILMFNFPWQQLSSLTVTAFGHPQSATQVMQIVEKCLSLVHLEFHNICESISPDDEINSFADCTATFLKVDHIPPSMIMPLTASGQLISLKIESPINLTSFNRIVRRAPSIKNIDCILERNNFTLLGADIFLRRLTSLKLEVPDAASFPRIVTPGLLSLQIVTEPGSGLFITGAMVDFFKGSNFKLETFDYRLKALVSGSANVPDDGTPFLEHDLFSTFDSCSVLCIRHVEFPPHFLHQIATGQRFPQVRDLTLNLSSSSAPQFVDMVKHRLETDKALNRASIRSIVGYIRYGSLSYSEFKRMESELRDAGQTYNAVCRLTQFSSV